MGGCGVGSNVFTDFCSFSLFFLCLVMIEIKTKWNKLRAKQAKSDDKTRPLLSNIESKMAGDMI